MIDTRQEKDETVLLRSDKRDALFLRQSQKSLFPLSIKEECYDTSIIFILSRAKKMKSKTLPEEFSSQNHFYKT